jgi:hypothetical protein
MLHTKLLDLSLDRDKFNHHGMHLNSKGTENVAKITGQHLIDLLNRQDNNILLLPWTDVNKDSISFLQTDVSVSVQSSEIRASERSRGPPVTKFNDFYGQPN